MNFWWSQEFNHVNHNKANLFKIRYWKKPGTGKMCFTVLENDFFYFELIYFTPFAKQFLDYSNKLILTSHGVAVYS